MNLPAVAGSEPELCPVTLPETAPVEVPGQSGEYMIWFGSPELAVLLPKDGHWLVAGNHGLRQKLWWWHRGYDPHNEPAPALAVEATRVDGEAPLVRAANATNGYGEGWSAMLTGIDFPTNGCWRVDAQYREEALTFVVQIGSD